ncbi:hypothetical protein Godav_023171 [Gossypium davidsonii]|uniref:Uncharacterized protein n=1 Tax=Gossypium davidsonii TaxID=34287 RepID=A0A7J8SS89_GOSDV|nr:hypothetical protein [Gossypium davidsonii]
MSVSNVNTFQAILLYGILQNKQICIGEWIYHSMKHCINDQKVRVFFPHLVLALCKKLGVLMEANKQFMRLTKSLIGDFMNTQKRNFRHRLDDKVDVRNGVSWTGFCTAKCEEEEKEEVAERDSQEEEDDDYKVKFHPQQSTQRGLVIHNTTGHAHSLGGGSS